MKRLVLAALFCLFTSSAIQADPFVILPNGELAFNTSFTTQGVFNCSACTGSGTNSVTFGSGGNTVTLTFTGVDTMIVVGGQPVAAVLGQISVVASGSGFDFPSHPTIPVITLSLGITQSSPTAGMTTRSFVSIGGGTSLNFVPFLSDHIQFPTGPHPGSFTHIVYTFSPFSIPNTNGTVNINSNISAVPEPATILLLGSGVGIMLSRLRKRSKKV